MLERFLESFPLTARPVGTAGDGGSRLPSLLAPFAGCTFRHGLYRVHDAESARAADLHVAAAFPEYSSRIACFGIDWLGDHFSVDAARGSASDPDVLLFEPGTGEVLEIPVPFSRFHDGVMVDDSDAVLASDFFEAWSQAHPADLPLGFDQCVGYQVPLFLGGPDTVENLNVIDIDVYWTISAQLRNATRDLEHGTTIDSITIGKQGRTAPRAARSTD